MRAALLAPLLGGCLIVRTTEETIEDPCPTIEPVLIAEASGPFTFAGNGIYFLGSTNGVLSYIEGQGGVASELTTVAIGAVQLTADSEYLYWATFDGVVLRKPLAGGGPTVISDGHDHITQLVVTDTHVVWASNLGLLQWNKTDEALGVLDASDMILGLDVADGIYYFSDTRNGIVRRTPPTLDLATAPYPGPLVVTDRTVYFYEGGDPLMDTGSAGALRLVPIDGGPVVTTARDLAPVVDLATDGVNLVFASAYYDRYRIRWVSRFGGTVRTLACGPFDQQPIYVAVTPQHVYWSDARGLYRLDPLEVAP